VSIGMDDDRSIAVHNSKTSALVGTGKAGRGIAYYGVFVFSFLLMLLYFRRRKCFFHGFS
jgi:hypothetical protein